MDGTFAENREMSLIRSAFVECPLLDLASAASRVSLMPSTTHGRKQSAKLQAARSIQRRRLINRTLTQTQECITDTTITNRIKQGDVQWNREETTRNVPSRDGISLGRPA